MCHQDICIVVQIHQSNLLNNAFDHGISPVVVRLKKEDGKINIQVSDQGDCQFENLDDITEEFAKGNKSRGTGLGLNIVRKVVEGLKGSLRFEKGPTRFSIIFVERQDNVT